MDSNRANRSFTGISARLAQEFTESHLRVPQTDLLRHPYGSSTAVRCHCAAMRRAMVVSGEKRGLKANCQELQVFGNATCIPLTRLLLDSNFVSITDMADYEKWESIVREEKSELVIRRSGCQTRKAIKGDVSRGFVTKVLSRESSSVVSITKLRICKLAHLVTRGELAHGSLGSHSVLAESLVRVPSLALLLLLTSEVHM